MRKLQALFDKFIIADFDFYYFTTLYTQQWNLQS